MLTEEQRKLLTEFLGECWHEFEDERVLPDCTWRRCVHCKKVSPFPSANVASFEPWLKLRTFDNWQDFGALKEALVKKGLWDAFTMYCFVHHYMGIEAYNALYPNNELENYYCKFEAEFISWLIDKDRFPMLVAEFMEGRND